MGQSPDIPAGSGKALAEHCQCRVLCGSLGRAGSKFLKPGADRSEDDAVAPRDEAVGPAASTTMTVRTIPKTDQTEGLCLIQELLNLSDGYAQLLREQVVRRPNDRDLSTLPVLRLRPGKQEIDDGDHAQGDAHIRSRPFERRKRVGRCHSGLEPAKFIDKLRRLGGMLVKPA